MSRYIDADELNKMIEAEFEGVTVYDVSPNEAVSDFQNIVDSCKTVDAAPVVHGHWIYLGGGLAKCSVCKRVVKDCYDQDNEDPFCRKCGAKMDESEDSGNV